MLSQVTSPERAVSLSNAARRFAAQSTIADQRRIAKELMEIQDEVRQLSNRGLLCGEKELDIKRRQTDCETRIEKIKSQQLHSLFCDLADQQLDAWARLEPSGGLKQLTPYEIKVICDNYFSGELDIDLRHDITRLHSGESWYDMKIAGKDFDILEHVFWARALKEFSLERQKRDARKPNDTTNHKHRKSAGRDRYEHLYFPCFEDLMTNGKICLETSHSSVAEAIQACSKCMDRFADQEKLVYFNKNTCVKYWTKYRKERRGA